MYGTRGKILGSLVAAALALGACDDGGTGSGAPRLSIRLTDAPGDVAEAWVKVDRVYLQGTSAADSTSGRQELPLVRAGEWVDLLTLSGGKTSELVAGATVPAGTYSQLRFVVCEAYIVTKAGDVFASGGATLPAGVAADGELQLPSTCQSGFKVKLPGGSVTLDQDTELLVVDFDVSQSFHPAGKNKWVMRPTLLATNAEFSAGISGTVATAQGVTLPACGGAATSLATFVPRAVAGADSVSGTTQASGAYTIARVTPGTWTLSHATPMAFANGDTLTLAATAAPATVTVGNGASATANYTITAATCKVKA